MDSCLAKTCKGTRCTRKKTSAHYCKIHTTNEVCTACGSTQISKTDSIYKNSGKSLCIPCIQVHCDEILKSTQEYVQKIIEESDAKRVANVAHVAKMREMYEQMNQPTHEYNTKKVTEITTVSPL